MSTKRAETRVDWKVAVQGGRVQALESQIYYAAGVRRNSCEVYAHLVGLAGMASYEIPHFRAHVHLMRLHRAPTGPLRGAGIPQGGLALETIMERTAHALKVDPHEFRERHLRSDGSLWLGAPLVNVFERACWNEVLRMSQYEGRAAAVREFNEANPFKKRGLAAIANVHPSNWKRALFLQQARAMVHVQADGSVLIAHQGIEMGQGVHQKMVQVAAHELGVPVSDISVIPNHTSVLGSTVVDTGGSTGTETNALAIKEACRKIRKRMQNISDAFHLDASKASFFKDIAALQQRARVALSVLATVQTYDPVEQASREKIDMSVLGGFKYYCYGASVVEVELDVLTGAYHFVHASVCAEWGKSLSPAIDLGQLEGGFLQALSWATCEQIRYCEKTGAVLNASPDQYHIATAFEAPRDFHAKLLPHAPEVDANPINSHVYSVKATGEPGYNLGAAAFIAIQRAVLAARPVAEDNKEENKHRSSVWLTLPATHEVVRTAIGPVPIKKI